VKFPGPTRHEIQYAKGHKYLTLVYQIDEGITRLLRVGKERTLESFQSFFTVIGEQLAAQIEFVCSDMWQPYLDVIRQKCSQALHILDRFHKGVAGPSGRVVFPELVKSSFKR
jgi:transposase